MQKKCDIIIPVYNGLNYAIACIESVLKHTDYPYAIIVIDDASDVFVHQALCEYCKPYPHIKIIRNEKNMGFVRSANKGILASESYYTVLLNSDTYVTPGWLRKLVECAESDARIMIVNPISNNAANLSIPLPPGFTIFMMSQAISKISRRSYPDIVTAVGFCFFARREIFTRLGGFDEVFDMGYCEESDFCMKAISAGYRVVAADDTFVFHQGGSSFGSWHERYHRNRKIFDQRWGKDFFPLFKKFQAADPLRYLSDSLYRNLRVSKIDASLIKSLWHMAKATWRRGGIRGIISSRQLILPLIISTTKKMTLQLASNPSLAVDATTSKQYFATHQYITNLPKTTNLQIAFLVDRFSSREDSQLVIRLANALIRKGHTVFLVTLSKVPESSVFLLYTQPLRYRTRNDMKSFPEVNIVVAMSSTAAFWLDNITEEKPDIMTVYNALGESDLFSTENRAKILKTVSGASQRATYQLVQNMQGREWLNMAGCSAHTIPIGVDDEIFYQRHKPPFTKKKLLVFLAIPEGPSLVAKLTVILQLLLESNPDAEIIFYGKYNKGTKYSFANSSTFVDCIADGNKRANFISDCDAVFIPHAHTFAEIFALEAMACGIPVAMLSKRGFAEFANEKNAVHIDLDAPEEAAAALRSLLTNAQHRNTLIQSGIATAKAFSASAEIDHYLDFFAKIAQKKLFERTLFV